MSALIKFFSNGVAGITTSFLDVLIGIINAGNLLVGKIISLLGSMLQGLIVFFPGTGGAAVYAVWGILRDICNIGFLAIMVLVAFGTIFNAVYKNPFHYSSALFKLIIAAILINFSLAFGQAIIALGNGASNVVLNLLGPQDLGAQIAASVQLPNIISDTFNPPLSPAAISAASAAAAATQTAVAAAALSPAQLNTVQVWLTGQKTGTKAPTLALSTLRSCLENKLKPTAQECMVVAQNIFQNSLTQNANAAAAAPTQYNVSSLKEVDDFWRTFILSGGKTYFSQPLEPRSDSDPSTRLGPLVGSLLKFFMLIVLMLSFATIIIFLVARIPFLWMLLSVSAGAFIALAWPYGGSSMFTKWWKQVVGWSIFGPLYLFNIYIGLYILSKQDQLIASLGQGSQIGNLPIATMFGSVMLFIIGCVIFIGGAGWCTKLAFSFSGGKYGAEGLFGKIGGALGVSEKSNFGINTVASRLGRHTGVTAAYQAGRERLGQEGQRIVASARGRYPRIFSSEEEALARARKRFNVAGGAEEVAKQLSDNITKRQTELENKMKPLEASVAAEAALARAGGLAFDETSELKKRKDAFLEEQAKSGNRDIKFAANEMRTKLGTLKAAEMKAVADAYGDISSAAREEYVKRVATSLTEKADKKEFKGADEIKTSLELLSSTQRAGLLRSVEKQQPLLAAELADSGYYTKKDAAGTTVRATFSDIVDRQSNQMSDEDWVKLYENRNSNGVVGQGAHGMNTMSDRVKSEWDRKIASPKEVRKLMLHGKAETRERIRQESVGIEMNREAETRNLRQQEALGTSINKDVEADIEARRRSVQAGIAAQRRSEEARGADMAIDVDLAKNIATKLTEGQALRNQYMQEQAIYLRDQSDLAARDRMNDLGAQMRQKQSDIAALRAQQTQRNNNP